MSEEKGFHWRSSRSLDWQAGPNVKYANSTVHRQPTFMFACSSILCMHVGQTICCNSL